MHASVALAAVYFERTAKGREGEHEKNGNENARRLHPKPLPFFNISLLLLMLTRSVPFLFIYFVLFVWLSFEKKKKSAKPFFFLRHGKAKIRHGILLSHVMCFGLEGKCGPIQLGPVQAQPFPFGKRSNFI